MSWTVTKSVFWEGHNLAKHAQLVKTSCLFETNSYFQFFCSTHPFLINYKKYLPPNHQPKLHEIFQVRKSLPQIWSTQPMLVSKLQNKKKKILKLARLSKSQRIQHHGQLSHQVFRKFRMIYPEVPRYLFPLRKWSIYYLYQETHPRTGTK